MDTRAHRFVGGQLAGHTLLGRLGGGGQAELFLARGPAGPVALKVARPGHAGAILAEHAALAGADHPHLARLSGPPRLGTAGPGRPWLALRPLPGQSLAQHLAAAGGRGLPPDQAIAVAEQLCGALAYLHGRGWAHLDLKPANVMLAPGPAPHATLIDLGAAERPAAPRRRGPYGSAGFQAPELRGPRPAPAGPAADIYGLGLLLGLMLGQAPPALRGLLRDAAEPDPARRLDAIPDMDAFRARLSRAWYEH